MSKKGSDIIVLHFQPLKYYPPAMNFTNSLKKKGLSYFTISQIGKNYHCENSHKLKEYLSTGVEIIDLQNKSIDMSKIKFNSKNIEEALKHSYRSKIELF